MYRVTADPEVIGGDSFQNNRLTKRLGKAMVIRHMWLNAGLTNVTIKDCKTGLVI